MNIVIVCQARLGSSRLPRKVLLPLHGDTLIARFMERIKRSRYASTAVVATTTEAMDDELVDECVTHGFEVFRGHEQDLLDRHYRVGKQFGADAVVKIPSDCPLIDPHIIDRVIGVYISNAPTVDYVSNLHPATYPDGCDVEVMSMDMLEKAWQQATRLYEREHTTPWFWDDNDEVRCMNVAVDGRKDYSMTHRWTIDYPEDYQFVRAVYDALYVENPRFGFDDVLRLVDEHPEIASLNARLAGVNWYRHHLNDLQTISASQTRPFPVP